MTVRGAYYVVIAALVLLAFAAAAVQSETLTLLLTAGLPIIGAVALVSVAYLWRVYTLAGRSSWVFRMLIESATTKVLGGIYTGVIAALFLAGVIVDRERTAPFSLVAGYLLLIGPIYYAATIAERRRRTGRPLPLRDDD